MKKQVLSIMLACLVLLSLLVSCGETPNTMEAIVGLAVSALEENAYSATSTIGVESTNSEIADVVATLNGSLPTITYSVKDGQFTAKLNMSVSDVAVEKAYTLKDGVLYSNSLVSASGVQTVVKKKAIFDGEKLTTALTDIGAGAEIDYTDFSKFVIEGEGEKYTISFTEMKPDALTGVDALMGGALEEAGYTLTLTNVTMKYNIESGKYLDTQVTYTYQVEADGETYSLTTSVTTTYDYTTEVVIFAPQDTGAYELVGYEDVLK